MPLDPSKALHFDSWQQLLLWLPRASEGQLMTIFVWAGDQRNVPVEAVRELAEVRKESFEVLVGRTRNRLRSFLDHQHGCRDPHLTEDVVQDVLLQIYCRAEQFDPQRSFWGWIYRIARNKYADSLRRLRPGSVGAGQTGAGPDEQEKWLEEQAVTTATPEDDAVARERKQRLADAIAKLPGLQRQIVQHRLDGVKGTEIAKKFQKSQAYVSQAYHEAVAVIREQVGE